MTEIKQDYGRGDSASIYGKYLPESLQPRPFNRQMEPSSQFCKKEDPWDEMRPIHAPPNIKNEMQQSFENYDPQSFPPSNMEWITPPKCASSQNSNNWTQSTPEKNWVPSQQNNAHPHNNQCNPIQSMLPTIQNTPQQPPHAPHSPIAENMVSPYREPMMQVQSSDPVPHYPNTNPLYPNSNSKSQYPSSKPEAMQYRNSNPGPQYPNSNRVPQYPNSNLGPHYPNSNLGPQFPKSNHEPQYPTSNLAPYYQNSNTEPQYPNRNHKPQYPSSSHEPQYRDSNHEPQYPKSDQYYQNNNTEPQYPHNYRPQLKNFSQNHSGPEPTYQNQENIFPQPSIALGNQVLNFLADKWCPSQDLTTHDLRHRIRREPAQYCGRAQKRRKYNFKKKSKSPDKKVSPNILKEVPSMSTAPNIDYSNCYDPENTQIAFYNSPNGQQTINSNSKESFLHRLPISSSTPMNSNPNSNTDSPLSVAVDEITGLPGGMSPASPTPSTRSVTPVYHTDESFSDSGVSSDADDYSDFPFETKCKDGAYPVSQIPFIDAHCHIDYIFVREKHYGSFNSFIKTKEFPSNFSGCIANFCDPVAWGDKKMYEAVLDEDGVWAAFGLHPHNAEKYDDEIEEMLVLAASHPKCVAWGEMGLDFGLTGKQDPDIMKLQSDVFKSQIRQGLDLGKPFVIHGRGANEETFDILKETTPEDHKIHFHCFTGEASLVERMLEHFPNLYIGFTGLVTYDQNKSIQSVVHVCPLDRILVETDSPYMRPAGCSHIDQLPYNSPRDAVMRNNKTCHPGMGMIIAAKIADLRGIPLDDMLIQLRENVRDMYGV